MDNGNGGPGNRVAQDFERSMSEAPQFNPEVLPIPENEEKDPGNIGERAGNNPNANAGFYIDPSMLGASVVQAAHFGGEVPGLGEIVTENTVGMKNLSEDQITGTDVDISKFQKNGVSKELEQRLDDIKKEPNLYQQSIDFMLEAKKSLSSSFADRKYLTGGQK